MAIRKMVSDVRLNLIKKLRNVSDEDLSDVIKDTDGHQRQYERSAAKVEKLKKAKEAVLKLQKEL